MGDHLEDSVDPDDVDLADLYWWERDRRPIDRTVIEEALEEATGPVAEAFAKALKG